MSRTVMTSIATIGKTLIGFMLKPQTSQKTKGE